jgi:hypothetical protein
MGESGKSLNPAMASAIGLLAIIEFPIQKKALDIFPYCQ